MKFFLNLFVWQ